ncbi:MAG: hypothetical protein OI74_01120 [Gammaproteobacteria bacterium (ex Lamellibrachia satsuma)]|nr:MAG: hypothetical protein HPY30_18315 [Gammaproteobacteria bacterium (ex Lamellibrachia satsuma)]RRS35985.1 MAG: hypothetical protein OI74_01120 [Gammaproteobacteria bacterium (ex Lamellibrachia satsuma)]RRS36577.1 MAG: hypothetical protein NV67_06790 [Gammaproteobacteria bacterium (ex Lamellibrachia satsuma)]
MGDDVIYRIRHLLLASLRGIECHSEQEANDAWEAVSISDLYSLNWAMLLTSGIGEDHIYLNESMEDGTSILDVSTLYEYDYADYLFQEHARFRDFSEYAGSRYYGISHGWWIRLLIDGQLYYATVTSLTTHLMGEIEEAANGHIDNLIPSELIEGESNGKRQGGGFLWDMRTDANGLEGQLDELKRRWWAYQDERRDILGEELASWEPAVYMKEENWDDDPSRSYIFTNAESLQRVRWRHYLSDCASLLTPLAETDTLLKREAGLTIAFLDEAHADIMENFDPKVIKLRKKKKIIMASGVFDELGQISSKLSDDDES